MRRCSLVEWHPIDYSDYSDYTDDGDYTGFDNEDEDRYAFFREGSLFMLPG